MTPCTTEEADRYMKAQYLIFTIEDYAKEVSKNLCLLLAFFLFHFLFDHEDGAITSLRKVSSLLLEYMTSSHHDVTSNMSTSRQLSVHCKTNRAGTFPGKTQGNFTWKSPVRTITSTSWHFMILNRQKNKEKSAVEAKRNKYLVYRKVDDKIHAISVSSNWFSWKKHKRGPEN
jgi:hypothetical protein